MSATVVHHPWFARYYARLSLRLEPEMGPYRRRLLAGLSGRVIEIGAGNGLNLAYYPPEVTHVHAVEPEPHLRALAAEQAAELAAETSTGIEVVDGVADELPTEPMSFDAAVFSLVLCSVPDQMAALTEARRVVRPGGELRFFEHVRAESSGLRRVQQVLDATVWPHVVGGCHVGRDTATAIERAGFTITSMERLRVPDTRLTWPATLHILGVATRG
jgi:ubiquinone/menaquinone biosynthesis C-methylase UbiE